MRAFTLLRKLLLAMGAAAMALGAFSPAPAGMGALAALAGVTTPAVAQAEERAAVALWNALVPLKSINTFMNTGAHPDDEISAVLAYVSRGLGARTISVIANRGEGGQNAIGTEYGSALGVVRSLELKEAGKVTGVEVVHLSRDLDDPIFDFGFSKTPEETLEKWGHDVALERLVRIIRETRPDVVLTSFQDSPGQHGHHRAVTRLTLEAFEKAADPTVFPEHLQEGLRPWQIKKVYLPAGSGGGGVYADEVSLEATVTVPTGEYDPILGVSYVQLGEESRSYHKSQGMGQWVPEGPATFGLHLTKAAIPVAEREQGPFDGLPQTLGDLAKQAPDEELARHLSAAQEAIDAALAAYPRHEKVAAAVHEALDAVRNAATRVRQLTGLDREVAYDLLHRLQVKEQQLARASQQALVLVTRLQASQYELTRGSLATFTLTAFRGGPVPVEDVTFDLIVPAGWKVERQEEPQSTDLRYNETAKATFKVTVPPDAAFFHPYQKLPLYGVVRYRAGGVPVQVTVEPQKLVAVLPDVSLRVQPDGFVYNLDQPAPLTLNVAATSYQDGAVQTSVSVQVPDGWRVEPQAAPVSFKKKGEVQTATFTVKPPAGVAAGRYRLAVQTAGVANSRESVRVIEYQHIGRTYMVQPAAVDVQVFSVKVPSGLKVGYVASGFDSVPDALRQLGIDVALLGEKDLLLGDLSTYDTIVLGVRAYRSRPDLVAANRRLLEYVKNGGNLVVQYHQPGDNWNPNGTAPYYLEIGSPSFNWRVTDENSLVEVLEPDHPLLTHPNRISEADWQGWVKDRGLYFASKWAKEFTPLLSMHDPGENPLTGSLLTATYGKGRYTFTSLILYYQMEQRVPGAYRLFTNLITPPGK